MRLLEEIIWDECLDLLKAQSVKDRQARGFIGKLRKFNRDADILFAFSDAQKKNVVDMVPWLSTVLATAEGDEDLIKRDDVKIEHVSTMSEEQRIVMEFKRAVPNVGLVKSALIASKISFVEGDLIIIKPLTNFARDCIGDRLEDITNSVEWRVRLE